MSNETLVRRFYGEVATGRSYDALAELFTDDFVLHGSPGGGDLAGAGALRGNLDALHSAFEGLAFTIEDVVSEGDRVAARWTMRGTHVGDFHGRAPTGRPIEQRGMVFYRVAGDRLAEQWLLVAPAASPAPTGS